MNAAELPDVAIEQLTVTRLVTDEAAGWKRFDDDIHLEPGEFVPGTRYKILEWIGEGGMGQVFRALHVDIERPVALKVLQSKHALSADLAAQFLSEAQACAKVESRFVVEVMDFGEFRDGRPFFVMELLGHETVHDALELGWMSLERAIPILRQCCKALAAIHDAGLIHRDIKPKNVVLQREDGRDDTIRVVDFGLAIPRGATTPVAGTAPYMAPEMILGRDFDGRVDIYALGCMAYEMLSRRPPFVDLVLKVLDAHVEQAPHPVTKLRPTLPAAVDPILLRCLEKDPEQRWPNPHEFEAALVELQIALGFVTPWDNLPMPMVDEARRTRLAQAMPRANRRSPWFLAAGLGAMLVTGTAAGLLIARPDADPSPANEAGANEQGDLASAQAGEPRIEALTNQTRLAASKAYWVYPAGDDPEQATALHWIGVLESEQGPVATQAHARATELRAEIADTLVRLGDRYWGEAHGRSFALEYYAMALVFVPDLPLDGERNPLTQVQLADLIARAKREDFSTAELRAARAMAILAEEDVERQRRRLVELVESDGGALPLHATEQLAELVGAELPDTAEEPSAGDPPNEADDDAADAKSPGRHPARAAALVEQARAAAAKGDRAGARRAFTEALEADSLSGDALSGLAELHFEAGEYGKALRHARKASRLRPRDGDLLILVGDCYLKTLRYASARSTYKTAAERGHPKAGARLAHLDELTSG